MKTYPNRKRIQAQLQRLANIDAFSKASNIPRRTLMRVKLGEEQTEPTLRTLMRIADALQEHKPATKPRSKA